MTVDMPTINAFCRLKDLVFKENGDEGVYRFLDFTNKSREFDGAEILRMVKEGYSGIRPQTGPK